VSLLRLEGVVAGYGDVTVLHGIDLAVEDGEIAVLLGANGAGKTTTLRAISGTLRHEGDIHFDGSPLPGRAELVAQAGVALVPQGRGTFADLSVDENLRLGAITRRDPGVAADLARWYEMFPRLAERRTQAAGSMSGGEQQMLAIARAMMSRPRLLLLDEPSLGLAPIVTQAVFETLDRINREDGLTMLVVEQNANLALGIADRGFVLETGAIVARGTAAELQGDDAVRKAYLGL
jgi:branched-chain amino acid transport system ATP-binding protein